MYILNAWKWNNNLGIQESTRQQINGRRQRTHISCSHNYDTIINYENVSVTIHYFKTLNWGPPLRNPFQSTRIIEEDKLVNRITSPLILLPPPPPVCKSFQSVFMKCGYFYLISNTCRHQQLFG